MEGKGARLPENVTPVNYDLFFEPDLGSFTFHGRETIDISIAKGTSEIVLNAYELKISSATLEYRGRSLTPSISMGRSNERVVLKFDEEVGPDDAKLIIEFEGELNDKLAGFYRSKYKDGDEDKYLATTQFEAPSARRAFPCFDEPEMKATFDVSLKIDRKLNAISNMPVREEREEGEKKVVSFDRSPKMSTYLLYMGVGEFEFIEDRLDDITIRVATVPGKKEQGRFALDLAKKFLSYFQDYSGIPYPLPKLDLVAIPDFAAGAMENWGAITFREIALLYDEKNTSTHVKKRIAEVVAHELWHQWSGNLVTMKWWNDLWLNESFATYMAYKAVDHYFPEWKVMDDFVTGETNAAFSADSLKTTHPIDVEVKSPNEIEELFDKISYGKGGSVLRMIERYLGEETFRDGVRKYLSRHAYSNADARDLWDSLAEVSSVPIREIMEGWIRQPGYPLVTAKKEGTKVKLSQKRFNDGSKQKWMIPLVLQSEGREPSRKLFTKPSEVMDSAKGWFKLNYGQEGFYRVKYSKEDLAALKSLVSGRGLSTPDRWGLQSDLFSLSIAGEVAIEDYLDFLKAYENEENYFILRDIYANLNRTHYYFSQDSGWKKIWPAFREHMKKPYTRALERLGWEPKPGESQEDALLRPLAIGYLAFAEDPDVLEEGKRRFEEFLKGGELHADIKGAVNSIAAMTGDRATYEQMLEAYSKSQSHEEKIKLLGALGKFRDKGILRDALDFALSDKVRAQDLRTVIPSVSSNPESRDILFPWVKDRWDSLWRYQKTSFIFMDFLKSFITTYTGEDKEKELREFLESKKVEYEKTKANAFETMQMNTRWMKKNRKGLVKYFE